MVDNFDMKARGTPIEKKILTMRKPLKTKQLPLHGVF